MDFKMPLAQISISITFSPNSDNELGLFAFFSVPCSNWYNHPSWDYSSRKMSSDSHLLNFQYHFIANFIGSSSFSEWAFSWLRIFRNSFPAVTYSTSLEFIFWILRIETATSALMLVRNVQYILSSFLDWGCTF